ncbi:MAG: diaminopimelate epimerase, partial [Salinisphaeraceae bacterium]|nr:diaminopimelate epimerase [Salinisphaeraceae bacterium]
MGNQSNARQFSKMHGLGNDFVVFDATRQPLPLSADQARQIADRRFGIGCDQILIVEPPPDDSADFRYRIFNADGGEVGQCGNGARCFARFVRDKGLIERDEIRVVTCTGPMVLNILDDGQVRVNMGVPRFEPEEIPFTADTRHTSYALDVDGESIEIAALSMGNPHAVLRVDDVDTAPVETLGPQIESHNRFPQRVNAGFLQIIDPGQARLRVYERGSGETLACGSGACAAMVAGRQWGLLDHEAAIQLRGGILQLNW